MIIYLGCKQKIRRRFKFSNNQPYIKFETLDFSEKFLLPGTRRWLETLPTKQDILDLSEILKDTE